MALLPFQHKVFDSHLASVRVAVDDSHIETYKNAIRDDKHWHNKKPLGPKRLINPPQQPYTKWRNPNIWNQRRFRDMEKYAKSLTNAKGNALEPQSVLSPELRKAQPKEKTAAKSSKGKKIAEENEKNKLAKEEPSWVDSWKKKVREIEAMAPRLRLKSVSPTSRSSTTGKGIFWNPKHDYIFCHY